MTKGLILAMKLINLAGNRNRLTCFNPGYYDYRGQAVLCLRFEDDDRPTGSSLELLVGVLFPMSLDVEDTSVGEAPCRKTRPRRK